jgi:hypothetical protein
MAGRETDAEADFSTAQRTVRLCTASVEMTVRFCAGPERERSTETATATAHAAGEGIHPTHRKNRDGWGTR